MTDSAWWWAVPAAALSFAALLGFVPGFLLRLLVLLYPRDDPRRRELVAELYVLGRMERMEWVFQQLETALFEGVAARLERRRGRGEADEGTIARAEEPREPPETDEREDTERRKFLAFAAAVTIGADVLGSHARSLVSQPVFSTGPRIRMTDVRQVEAVIRALNSLDQRYGAEFRRDAVAAQLSLGERLLSASGSDVVRRRLHVALADLHNFAGWTAFDLGLIDSARHHFGRALELAKAGNSNQLVANILYRMGRVYMHQGAPNDALKMFQLSQLAAQESGPGPAAAVICANQAVAYAMMGHEEQTAKLIGRAREEFARGGSPEAEAWREFLEPALTELRAGGRGPGPRTGADPR